jgi:hypothetical protein
VGRPNLIRMPLYPVQEDKSLHYQAGTRFNFFVKELFVWCFTDAYPMRIEVDCQHLAPNYSIKIGDIEKMLPYGMYLHKQYDTQKFHSVVRVKPSNVYVSRKNALVEQRDLLRDQRNKLQTNMMDKAKEGAAARKEKSEKSVPIVVKSAKFILAQKKEAEK